MFKYGGETLKDITEERERWLAGVSAESYARYVNVPMLYVSSTNSASTDMERAFDTMSRIIQSESYICVSTGISNYLADCCVKDVLIFFDKYLRGKDYILPEKATLEIENRDGACLIRADEKSGEAQSVSIYVSECVLNPAFRNWHTYKAEKKDGFYVATPKINCGKPIFAFANVTYKNGFTQSTNLCVKNADELKLSLPPFRRSPVIYSGEMGKDSFIAFSPYPPQLNELFGCKSEIEIKKGAGSISGIGGCKGLATFKIGEAAYKGSGKESFKFDVYSATPQELTVYFSETGEKQHYHSCKIRLSGGNLWQPAEIKKQDLKTEEGIVLKNWEDVSMAAFFAENEFIINNILWI